MSHSRLTNYVIIYSIPLQRKLDVFFMCSFEIKSLCHYVQQAQRSTQLSKIFIT